MRIDVFFVECVSETGGEGEIGHFDTEASVGPSDAAQHGEGAGGAWW